MVSSAASHVVELAQLWGGFVEGDPRVLAGLFDPELAALPDATAPVGPVAASAPNEIGDRATAYQRWKGSSGRQYWPIHLPLPRGF